MEIKQTNFAIIGLGGRGQVETSRRIGEDRRRDIPSLDDEISLRRHPAQDRRDAVSDLLDGRDLRGVRVDLRRANAVTRCLALHVVGDRSVLRTALDLHLRGESRDCPGIGRVDPVLETLPRHDAVERTRIDVQIPEFLSDNARYGALSRSARPVNCDYVSHF